jgi:hypothetical protein
MHSEDNTYVIQWFHSLLNPPSFEELAKPVWDATDLTLRRTNHRVANQFHDVSSKLELSRFHVRSAVDRLQFSRENVPAMLTELSKDLRKDLHNTNRKAAAYKIICEFRDHLLVAHLEAFLIQSKCLLDSLSQFHSLAFGRTIKTFSGRGENVLKDLKHLGKLRAEAAESIKAMLENAKASWIDQAITYRDEVVHFGQLRDFRCLHLHLKPPIRFLPEDVNEATMPSGEEAKIYMNRVLRQSHELSATWLSIIFSQLQDKK